MSLKKLTLVTFSYGILPVALLFNLSSAQNCEIRAGLQGILTFVCVTGFIIQLDMCTGQACSSGDWTNVFPIYIPILLYLEIGWQI